MNTTSKSHLSALLCALVLLLCAVATYPVAEIGMNDDWSYIKSAQVLAQTGHVVYNGWASAMLGWQLFLGALFAKFFGPSFTAIRASTLFVAMVTAVLMQRTLVRAGINSRNATIGTLTLVLSPLFLPVALSFMTDIGGLFFIVLCLYACLRALQAGSDRAVLGWLAFAALSNALGGTVRQIAWLGALVMFPCAVWLLRRRPHVILLGVVLYPVSAGIIFGSLHWFHQQPYSLPEPLVPGQFDIHNLHYLGGVCARTFFSYVLFVLPVLLAFVSAVSFRNWRSRAVLVCGGVLSVAGYLFLEHKHVLNTFLAPVGNYIQLRDGFADIAMLGDSHTVTVARDVQLVAIAVILLALLCFLAVVLTGRRTIAPVETPSPVASVSWQSLLVLFVPFTLAYLALLLPRGSFGGLYDRYLLPLIFIGILLLLRLFQDYARPNLPSFSFVLIGLFAIYAIAGTHDAFSLYRAKIVAIAELRAAGIPDVAIDGGFEYNMMAEVERSGHVLDPHLRFNTPVQFAAFPVKCQPQMAGLTPDLIPGYTLSFDPTACGGPAGFAPVTYRGWLGLHTFTMYIDNTAKLASIKR